MHAASIRLSVIFCLTLCSNSTFAALRVWPTGICTTTLQACIDGSVDGDEVQIASNAPINENLVIEKSLTLTRSVGFRPSFGNGFGISGGSNSARLSTIRIDIKDLVFNGGGVDLVHFGQADAQFNVFRNRLNGTPSNLTASVKLTAAFGSARLLAAVYENRISSSTTSINDATIRVKTDNGKSNVIQIQFNQVESIGRSDGAGIGVFATASDSKSLSSNAVIFNNVVKGQYGRGAVVVSEGLFASTPVIIQSLVVNNVLLGRNRFGNGIALIHNNGSIAPLTSRPLVLNNTIVNFNRGITMSKWDSATTLDNINGEIQNNLFYQNGGAVSANPIYAATGVRNLLFPNISSGYTSSTDVTSDPLINDVRHPSVSIGSPAIDAGSLLNNIATFVYGPAGGLASVDADGLRRFKDATATTARIDIGAYEFGDVFFTAKNPATISTSNGFVISSSELVTSNTQLLQTAIFAGNGTSFVSTSNPFGVWFSSFLTFNWNIFLQNNTINMPAQIQFFTMAPLVKTGAFLHTHSGASAVSLIDNIETNTKPTKFVLATQNWNPPPSVGIYNNSHVTLSYSGPDAKWRVHNANGVDIPVGAGFNIYAQDRSPNAFVHEAINDNIAGDETILDHPLLNGVACARLLATPIDGVFGHSGWDIYYSASTMRWRIFRSAGDMPIGAKFHVLVDAKQTADCFGDLLSDGFED